MTEPPSVTATPVAKVNELSGNCSGWAKFVSLQVCLHLTSSALGTGERESGAGSGRLSIGALMQRGHELNSASGLRSLVQKWVKFDFVDFCF